MSLKHGTWYWLSHPHEGDVFYPAYIVDDVYMVVDGETISINENKDATYDEAVMPNEQD